MSVFLTAMISVIAKAGTEISTEATTEKSDIMKALDKGKEVSELSTNIMNIIYILIAAVIVIGVITITLYIYKFFSNRRNSNYKNNDDNFLDD